MEGSKKRAGRLAALGLVLLISAARLEAALPNGVAAGDTTQTSTVLWARSTAPGPIQLQVATDPGFTAVVRNVTATVADAAVPVRVEIAGLTPGTSYFYRVTDASSAQASGSFRTAAAAGERAGLRFGVSGDWRGELAPYPAVVNAPDRDLDFFVALGDTIYADFPSPDLPKPQAETLAEYRIKNSEVYSERHGLNTLAALRASTSTLATIDDHEVTNDFSGGAPPSSDPRFAGFPGDFINDTPLYENGLQAFQEYNPVRDEVYPADIEPRMAGERKLYRLRTFGSDAAVFVLDARSFRDQELPAVTNPLDPVQVGQFLFASFDPRRTMLGRTQVEELKRDLLAAHQAGITWKFVLMPEPIQNLGVVAASDRYEGYAAERTEILRFVDKRFITNVVFISADLHGTAVNNLTYQVAPLGKQIATGSWDIITGAVAFDAPLGPTVVDIAASVGLITPEQRAFYLSLPRQGKDQFFTNLLNVQLTLGGYDVLGLQGSSIPASLVSGGYVSAHTYGWTEFEIDPDTQRLRVKTYGIDFYTPGDLARDPAAVAARQPEVVSEFTVDPVFPCHPSETVLCLQGGRFQLEATWRRRAGAPRTAHAAQLNESSGVFWFRSPNNVDLSVKVVDGRLRNGSHWVLTSGLTGFESIVKVTDLQTGQVNNYVIPAGSFGSIVDTRAFPQLPDLEVASPGN